MPHPSHSFRLHRRMSSRLSLASRWPSSFPAGDLPGCAGYLSHLGGLFAGRGGSFIGSVFTRDGGCFFEGCREVGGAGSRIEDPHGTNWLVGMHSRGRCIRCLVQYGSLG